MNFNLPSKADVGVLDLEVAGEGHKVILSDGEQVTWSPPPPQPIMPDMSKIKTIQRYFNRVGFSPWPAWVYHPSEPARLLKNQDEGRILGIVYRKATEAEFNRYGLKDVWDWEDGCEWRPKPFLDTIKFDPTNPGAGKTYQPAAPNPSIAQHDLVRMLIPEVAAAVAQALKMSGPKTPAHVDPKDWNDFLEFKAWKETPSKVTELAEQAVKEFGHNPLAQAGVSNKLTDAQEWSLWEEEARSRNIKIDGRWSLERLRAEVEKASQE